jgi:hypothetical protein
MIGQWYCSLVENVGGRLCATLMCACSALLAGGAHVDREATTQLQPLLVATLAGDYLKVTDTWSTAAKLAAVACRLANTPHERPIVDAVLFQMRSIVYQLNSARSTSDQVSNADMRRSSTQNF